MNFPFTSRKCLPLFDEFKRAWSIAGLVEQAHEFQSDFERPPTPVASMGVCIADCRASLIQSKAVRLRTEATTKLYNTEILNTCVDFQRLARKDYLCTPLSQMQNFIF